MEHIYYSGRWVEGAILIWCPGLADRQTYKTGSGTRCIKVGTKVFSFLGDYNV